jgi:hypothetical protein
MGLIFDHEHGSVNQYTVIYFLEVTTKFKTEDNVVLSGTLLCNFNFRSFLSNFLCSYGLNSKLVAIEYGEAAV